MIGYLVLNLPIRSGKNTDITDINQSDPMIGTTLLVLFVYKKSRKNIDTIITKVIIL